MTTIDGIENLQTVFDGIELDFDSLDFSPVLKEELGKLEQLHAGFFRTSTGPDGAQWKPLAPSTIARKSSSKNAAVRARSHTILVETSALRESLVNSNSGVRIVVDEPAGTVLSFGTDVPYSIFHDQSSGSRPARRHVGVTDDYVAKMTNRIARSAVKGLKQ